MPCEIPPILVGAGKVGHVDWSVVSGLSHLTSYSDMFDQIESIVSHDYAGCDGNAALLPDVRPRVSKLGSRATHRRDSEFLRLVRYYLACTGDPNLRIIKLGSNPRHDWNVGFSARAAQDCLFVDEVWDDDRLCKGDRILAIDGQPISAYRNDERRRALFGVTPEREDWGFFLHYAKTLEIERAATGARLDIKPNHNALDARALAEMEPVLYCDLRHCKGGSFEGVEPLLPFLIDTPQSFGDFMGDMGLFCLYSKGNCDRMVASVEEQSRLEGWSEEEERAEVDRIEELAETGFVWEPALLPDEWLVPVEPDEGPRRVVVLCDDGCAGEAETLLQALQRQEKATIVGRSSRGASDFQQLFTVNFDDDMLFVYPMAQTPQAHDGRGINGRGVDADVYVPWTEAELEEDVILREALEL